MSTLKTSNIQHGSASTAAITLAADSTATLNGLAYPTSGSLSGRNRIINGDMRIDQRNAGAAVTPTATGYTLDRFSINISQSSKLTIQQNAGAVTPPADFKNYLGVTTAVAYTPITNDFYHITQYIEGYNIADLGWGTANAQSVTLSFWVRSSLTGTFALSLKGAPTRNYLTTYSISAANTWEKKVITIPGDTSGTWDSTNGVGINLTWSLGNGPSRESSNTNAWNTESTIYGTSTSVDLVATLGATFYITGVQLEAGTVATPFERRSYGQELSLCQRYYQTGFYAQMRDYVLQNANGSTSQRITTMRAAPTVTIVNTTEALNAFTYSLSPQGSDTIVGFCAPTSFGAIVTGFRANWKAEIEL